MEFIQYALVIALIIFAIIAFEYIDKRFKLNLSSVSGDKILNDLGLDTASAKQKDEEILALKKRIEVLEAIVTDPAHELDKQIRRL